MKKDQVLDYMDSLEQEDKNLDLYVKLYEALSSFLTDFEFMKDSLGMTQKDVADKMGTTQSAISRIASLKTNPSYKQLLKMAEAVGGDLYITPMKDMTVQVPYDLQKTVRKLAEGEDKTTNEYLDEVIRDAVESEYESYTKVFWDNVSDAFSAYKYDSVACCGGSDFSTLDFGEFEPISQNPEMQKIAV